MIEISKVLAAQTKILNETIFIAIDGHGGSGKTTFAKLLSEKLGAEVIHTDDFSSWDNPLNWFSKVIEEIFDPIAAGATSLSYQPTSWWENHHPDKVHDQKVTSVMIIEGVSAFRQEFRNYISLSFFVDTPKDECLRRGIARDANTGKSTEELTKMWLEWLAEEEVYFNRDDPKNNVDFVIDGTKPFLDQVSFS